MKSRPILFIAPMVMAILNGRKTQTRRVVTPQPDKTHDGEPYWNIGGYRAWSNRGITDVLRMGGNEISCPYGKPGDRLWVRETWGPGIHALCAKYDRDYHVVYAADGGSAKQQRLNDVWKPSIFMPRWASRITLEITGIRVERLHEISEADALAEGIKAITKDGGKTIKYGIPDADGFPGTDDHGWAWKDWQYCQRTAYRDLWQRINGTGSWDKNPLVWIIEFKRIEQ